MPDYLYKGKVFTEDEVKTAALNAGLSLQEYINKHDMPVTLYKPQNQKECDKVVELIKSKQ